MSQAPVDTDLTINVVSKDVIAHVIIKNNSDKDYYIDPVVLTIDGKLYKNVFYIVDASNEKVLYVGKMVKHIPKPENFINLKIKSQITFSVDLTEFYQFKPEKCVYNVKYTVYNSKHPDQEGLQKLESNTAGFTFP